MVKWRNVFLTALMGLGCLSWVQAAQIVLNFEETNSGLANPATYHAWLPENYGGLSWGNKIIQYYSNANNDGYSYHHSSPNYCHNSVGNLLSFVFPVATYPNARLVSAWFTKGSTQPAKKVRFVGYITGNPLPAFTSDWLVLGTTPRILNAVNLATNQPFGYVNKVVVEAIPPDEFLSNSNYMSIYTMDDLAFLDQPGDNPLADVGGPYKNIMADDTDGAEVTLMGTGSRDTTGVPITKYKWYFGVDGPIETTTPIMTHKFPVGTTPISLVVINNNQTQSGVIYQNGSLLNPANMPYVQVNNYVTPGQEHIITFNGLPQIPSSDDFGSYLPPGHGGIIWPNTIRYKSDVPDPINYPYVYNNYIYNYGSFATDLINFQFDPSVYPQGHVLGASFAGYKTKWPNTVQWVAYNAQDVVVAASRVMPLGGEPEFLEAIDEQTGLPFGPAARYVVKKYPADVADSRYSMDNLHIITSPKQIPVANAGGPYTNIMATSLAGAEVMLNGSGSYNPSTNTGVIASYEWDLDLSVDSNHDGNAYNDVDSTVSNPTKTYKANTTAYASLIVIGLDGTRSKAHIVTVQVNEFNPGQPQARIIGNYTNVLATDASGAVINLNGSTSSDAYGWAITAYYWDWDLSVDSGNDGVTDNDVNADTVAINHRFPIGTTDVALTVVNANGIISRTTVKVIVITPGQPQVRIIGNYTNVLATDASGADIVLDGSTSSDDYGWAITSYSWDLNLAIDSGTDSIADNDVDASSAIVTRRFPVGTTTVALTVINANGISARTTATVTVISPGQPQALITGNYINVLATDASGAVINLNGSTSSDAYGWAITDYYWDWDLSVDAGNDGVTDNDVNAYTVAINHRFPIGTTDIALTVVNANGIISRTTVKVIVITPGQPQARITGNYTNVLATDASGADIVLDGSTSSDDYGYTIASYAWDLNLAVDSGSDTIPDNDVDKDNATVTNRFPVGTTEVALIVVNVNGISARTTATVTVISPGQPQARITGSYTDVQATDAFGAEIILDGSTSSDDYGYAIASYAWDLNLSLDSDFDGIADNDIDAVDATVTSRFPAGTTDVALTVVNINGISARTAATVSIVPLPQVALDFDFLPPAVEGVMPATLLGIDWISSPASGLDVRYRSNELYPGYSSPHSGDIYLYNPGAGMKIAFAINSSVYPQGRFLGAWFTLARPTAAVAQVMPMMMMTTETVAEAEAAAQTVDSIKIRVVAYDSQNQILAATDWMTLLDEPQYLEAVDFTTGYYFGQAAYYVVEQTPETDEFLYAMDDLNILTIPLVLPMAKAGGPYTAPATSWDGAMVTLDGSASFSPMEGIDILAWQWDLNTLVDSNGDGDPANDTDATGSHVAVEFPIGQMTIALRVIDAWGMASQPETTTVAISGYAMEVDIRPGSDKNIVIMRNCGVVPIAIKTTPEFNAAQIKPKTITLTGTNVITGKVEVWGKVACGQLAWLVDIDCDGDRDLLTFVDIRKQVNRDVEALCEISAMTRDGYSISGYDTIKIIHLKYWWER